MKTQGISMRASRQAQTASSCSNAHVARPAGMSVRPARPASTCSAKVLALAQPSSSKRASVVMSGAKAADQTTTHASVKVGWQPIQKVLPKEDRLTIGIVGFGLFGQFLAKRMVLAGHRVIGTSRTPYEKEAKEMGAEFFRDVNDFCEEHPDVVILVTSILSTESVLNSLPIMRLKRSTLIVDVLSVKVFPKQLLLHRLPQDLDILCTHPMFGPNSGGASWAGLNFQYEKVRIGNDPKRQARVEKFLKFFADEECNMVEMTCEAHDQAAASTQFVTHTVGRMLGTLRLQETPIDTKGFQALLNLVNQTNTDSFDLYYGLFLYNQNATDELERLEKGLESVKDRLFSQLHDIARKEMFPKAMLEKQLSKNAGRILNIFFRGLARLGGVQLGARSKLAPSMISEDWDEPQQHRDHPEELIPLYKEMVKVWRQKALEAAKLDDQHITPLFSGSLGSLHFEEGTIVLPSRVGPALKAFQEAYDFVDIDGSGKVTAGELAARMLKLTSTRATPDELKAMMRLADVDGDGTLQLKELIVYVAYDFFSTTGELPGIVCPKSMMASLSYLNIGPDLCPPSDINQMLAYANLKNTTDGADCVSNFAHVFADIKQLTIHRDPLRL